jgi:hypothetical protein
MGVTDSVKATIMEMAIKGATPDVIAQEVNISISTVYHILKDEGLKAAHKSHGIGKERSDEMCKKYVETQTPVSALLVEFGATHQQLYIALAERSIPTRALIFKEQVEKHGNVRMEKAIELYQQGCPGWKIDQETGVRPPDLYNEMHRRGLPLRGRQFVGSDGRSEPIT